MASNESIRKALHDASVRSAEIRKAAAAYPGMEMAAAYRLWKEARGESATLLSSSVKAREKKAVDDLRSRLGTRPCTRDGCSGIQHLEHVCSGCIEGQAGYRSKWTCNLCMHRDLSKEDVNAWMQRLSSG